MPFPLQRLLLEDKRSEPVKVLGVSGNVRPSQYFSSKTEARFLSHRRANVTARVTCEWRCREKTRDFRRKAGDCSKSTVRDVHQE